MSLKKKLTVYSHLNETHSFFIPPHHQQKKIIVLTHKKMNLINFKFCTKKMGMPSQLVFKQFQSFELQNEITFHKSQISQDTQHD